MDKYIIKIQQDRYYLYASISHG